MSAETKDNQRFVVNLYEPKRREIVKRFKSAIAGAIVPIDSKLYITDSALDAFKEMKVTEDAFNKIENLNSILDTGIDRLGDTSNSICNMVQEAHRCSEVIKQASKALQTCMSDKQFPDNEHQAEAERVLLIAELKYNRLLQQIVEERHKNGKDPQICNTVNITLSNINLPLIAKSSDYKNKIWFVITCESKCDVQASPLIEKTSKFQSLNFPVGFKLENLPSNSIINFKVYQLKASGVKRSKRITSLIQKGNTSLRRMQKLTFKDGENVAEVEVFSTLFSFCGSVDLTVDHLLARKVLVFDTSSKDSLLVGLLSVISSIDNISLINIKSGFITVGTEINGLVVWDRKWCRMEDYILSFWATPTEEDINQPKLSLSLKYCVNISVGNLLTRPKTIVIELCSGDIVTKYYLCIDTSIEYNDWKASLNAAVESLNRWKKIQAKIQL